MREPDTFAQRRNAFLAGVIACGPTILGYASIGFAAGAIGSISGFSWVEITLLAALIYAGSAQFLFYSLWSSGAGSMAIVLAIALVNIRYLLMSSYLARFFAALPTGQKFISGMLLTDETFGVAAQYAGKHGRIPFWWMLGLNITAYASWISANIAGAAFASVIPVEISHRLGFSLTTMFIGLLALNYSGSAQKKLELVAMGLSAATVLVTLGVLDMNISILVATAVAATVCATLLRLYPALRSKA
ncbi:AzlC family ABC transporter permease [Affinibrenneria salicis]|uniref:AzlC family ABC transporter permease n=1 Tax=Affinibrenneria salicis TaxID=2590031 RepID=A0A5J5FYA8_9GAMM|nr:AzlC family ABC transporter permease [Affinibrenneria salicis]KAA8998604.1 AzlC family ABC transporter permease [Affinibrenneria salicis]